MIKVMVEVEVEVEVEVGMVYPYAMLRFRRNRLRPSYVCMYLEYVTSHRKHIEFHDHQRFR